jgi:hypothetical protein
MFWSLSSRSSEDLVMQGLYQDGALGPRKVIQVSVRWMGWLLAEGSLDRGPML